MPSYVISASMQSVSVLMSSHQVVFPDLVKGHRKCLVAGVMVCTVKGAVC